MRTSRLRWVPVAMATAMLLAPGSSAGAADDGLQLDPVPPVLHIGDTVTISGRGCLDRTTQSGSGRGIVLGSPQAFTGSAFTVIPVADDGTFGATVSIDEPVVDGPYDLKVQCTDAASPGEVLDPLDRASQAVTVIGASLDLDPTEAALGTSVTLRSPCSYDQTVTAGPTSISIDVHAPGGPIQLSPLEGAADLGDRITVSLADTGLDPGAVTVSAWCSPYRSPPNARSAAAELTLLPAGSGSAPTGPGADPAVPVPGTPILTG